MILALCVDDKLGLQFNRRRQSRDQAVTDDLLSLGKKLWVHPYSEKLFAGCAQVSENYLTLAQAGEICFAEDTAYLAHADKIEAILLYRWNRVYPRDLMFEFPGQWRLVQTREFAGTSHEKITREVYIP